MLRTDTGVAGGFTTQQFRQVMSRFVTGVTVVTVRGESGPHGATVNSFSSLSLDPALVLVCLLTRSRTSRALVASGSFAVNILGHTQQDVGRWFASTQRPLGEPGFAGIPYRPGATGSPLLEGCVAHIDCSLSGTVPAGDHTIFIGRVLDLGADADEHPLAFHRGRFLPLVA